ncbi:MAG: DNA-methyltransferase [Promethearchaeota archaeon]|jgi:DNA modification methylase
MFQKKLTAYPKLGNNSADFNQKKNIVLHHGLSYDFLKTIPDKIIRLIITSPPYNLGKIYENEVEFDKYLMEQELVINELIRVLADNGSVCWEIGNYVKDGELYPLDVYFYEIFKKRNLKLRNRIIWHFGHGLHCKHRFSGRYETILWFTKSNDYIFNLDNVRVPHKYPGKRAYKGPNKGKPSGNPLGKNPSDVWKILNKDWESTFWEFPNVKSNHPEKTIHPCQFPVELAERCILALTNENDYILDPYCGVGSSLIAGIKHNRKVIGVDKELEYINITKKRIEQFFQGKLKVRPLGKKLHQPTGREKVSQIPTEWRNLKEK